MIDGHGFWKQKAWSRMAAVCVIRAEERSGLHAQAVTMLL